MVFPFLAPPPPPTPFPFLSPTDNFGLWELGKGGMLL